MSWKGGGLAEYLAQDQVIDPAVYGVPVADVAARVPYSDAAIFQQVGLEVHETSSEVEEANHVQLSWGQAVTPNEKQPLVEARPNLLHGTSRRRSSCRTRTPCASGPAANGLLTQSTPGQELHCSRSGRRL